MSERNTKLIDFLIDNDLTKEGFYTHETIAWKLLVDDSNLDQLEGQLQTFSVEDDPQSDPISFFHEFLLSVFMEMIFDLATIWELNIDYDKFDINDFFPLIKDKMTKVSILPSIMDFDEDNEYSHRELNKNKYCRVVLKDNKSDRGYQHYLGDDNKYFMVGNPRFVKKDKLENVFSTCVINKKIYKISFSTVQKLIMSN